VVTTPTLECTVLHLCTLFITHAVIDLSLALRQRASARISTSGGAAINVKGSDNEDCGCTENQFGNHAVIGNAQLRNEFWSDTSENQMA